MSDNPGVTDSSFPPCLDRTTIQSLIQLGDDDPALFGELVEAFIVDSPARLQAMKNAAEAADAKLLAQSAHGLKSSAGNMGARLLGEMCAELERNGRTGDLADAGRLVARASQEFESVCSALRSLVR